MMILCGAALLTLTCSTILSLNIQTLPSSTSANQGEGTQTHPKTQFMTLVQKCENQTPQGPSTASVQAEIEELNNEITLQQGKNTNIPLSFSLQTTEQVYELLLATCQQRDQLQQEVDTLKLNL
ncbi:MAG: hypothetical protein HWD61_13440 [Parachlamydiaceae bacterium]|nr:MAG: hypothetical protein HWD61_13440 [Parachlamydiaceae bacterium]